jgi:hypothetical protein
MTGPVPVLGVVRGLWSLRERIGVCLKPPLYLPCRVHRTMTPQAEKRLYWTGMLAGLL